MVLMALAFVACVLLGLWQWGRYEAKAAEIDQIESAWDQSVTSVSELVVPTENGVAVPREHTWRATELTGHFVPGSQIQLRNRPVGGDNAVHLIALFATTIDGQPATVIVNRGWIPLAQADGDVDRPGHLPDLPLEETTLSVRARPEEAAFERRPAAGMTYTLNTDQVWDAALPLARETDAVQASTAAESVRVKGRFEAAPGQLGADVDGAPRPFPQPSVRMGSHMSYAFQWWFFALAALTVVPLLARREVAESDWVIDGVDLSQLNLTDEERRDLGLPATRAKLNRRYIPAPGSDEDIEDQIVLASSRERDQI